MKKKVAFSLITVSLLALITELCCFLVVSSTPVRTFYYRPPSVDGVEEYLRERSETLGWPPASREFVVRPSDASTRFSGQGDSVAVFGDSFTYGEEVSDDAAWCNQLAALSEVEVRNYGVGGYGTDQALLRYIGSGDNSKYVILGILTENVVRNVNRFRNLIAGGSEVKLKPRFIIGPSGLVHLPIPSLSVESAEVRLSTPEAWLSDDYFCSNRNGWPLRADFPYSFSLLALTGHWSFGARMRGLPMHAEFLSSSHESQAVAVTSAIAASFVQTARERGASGHVMIIPTCKDIESFKETGSLLHQDLLDGLSSIGPVWDATEWLARAAERPADLYVTRSSHMNPEGNRVLAHFVENELRKARR